jgi:hypothetical protein
MEDIQASLFEIGHEIIRVSNIHRRNLGGGLGMLITPIFKISIPKCVYVSLHLNTHYSLCIEKHNSF